MLSGRFHELWLVCLVTVEIDKNDAFPYDVKKFYYNLLEF